jgi:actin-like ATPase involved in cell morphogenesis
MASATAVVSKRDNATWRGLFNDTWSVTATLDSASVASGAAGAATDTITVAGVALGDMVIGMSVGVSEAGVVRRAYVSAANTVTVATDNLTGSSVDLASTTIKLIIARPV